MRETPSLECDLILKGGITSGVIYPSAVGELARTYRLRSVGGASSGAIAAAAAACAEYGRADAGFERLAALGPELGRPTAAGTLLLSLFQPQPRTARLFRLTTSLIGPGGRRTRLGALLAALRAFWWHATLGALPGLVLAVAAAALGGPAAWVGVLGGVLLAAVGKVAAVAWGAWRSAATDLPANGFGLCDGGPTGDPEPALTPWLHDRLQDVAGRPGGAPVTFGDLARRGVDLRMVTTNLTQVRPMTMPWSESGYYFDPSEWRRLFPAEVVDAMVAHPPPITPGAEAFDDRVRRLAAGALRPLPAASELPVVVATRLSVSFPLLMSAMRLYAIDFAMPQNQGFQTRLASWRRDHPDGTPEDALADRAVGRPRFDANWFSDGGLTSNLPLHFFDAPLPTRPTFAINLVQFRDDASRSEDESRNSYLPTSNAAGILRRWNPIDAAGRGALGSFLDAVAHTLVTWADEQSIVLPGYRDRVVRVYRTQREGGLNLAMSTDDIERLGERGRAAAAKLVDRFAGDRPGEVEADGWRNHRWVRLRSSVGALAEWLDGFGDRYTAQPPATTPYPRLLGPQADVPPPSYPLDADDRVVMTAFVDELLDLAGDAVAPALTRDAPRPLPTMRVVAYDRPPAWRRARNPREAPGGSPSEAGRAAP